VLLLHGLLDVVAMMFIDSTSAILATESSPEWPLPIASTTNEETIRGAVKEALLRLTARAQIEDGYQAILVNRQDINLISTFFSEQFGSRGANTTSTSTTTMTTISTGTTGTQAEVIMTGGEVIPKSADESAAGQAVPAGSDGSGGSRPRTKGRRRKIRWSACEYQQVNQSLIQDEENIIDELWGTGNTASRTDDAVSGPPSNHTTTANVALIAAGLTSSPPAGRSIEPSGGDGDDGLEWMLG